MPVEHSFSRTRYKQFVPRGRPGRGRCRQFPSSRGSLSSHAGRAAPRPESGSSRAARPATAEGEGEGAAHSEGEGVGAGGTRVQRAVRSLTAPTAYYKYNRSPRPAYVTCLRALTATSWNASISSALTWSLISAVKFSSANFVSLLELATCSNACTALHDRYTYMVATRCMPIRYGYVRLHACSNASTTPSSFSAVAKF